MLFIVEGTILEKMSEEYLNTSTEYVLSIMNRHFPASDSEIRKELTKQQKMKNDRMNSFINFDIYIKVKLELFNDFMKLGDSKYLKKNELIFHAINPITIFFQKVHEKLSPLVSGYLDDTLIGLEVLPIYQSFKKSFSLYNSKIDSIYQDKDNETIKEKFEPLKSKHNVSSIKSFIEIPQRMLTQIELQLKEIVEKTENEHPDIKNLKEMLKITHDVSTLVNQVAQYHAVHKSQITINKYFLKADFLRHDNPYSTVVDCMYFSADGSTLPKMLLVLENSVVISDFVNKIPPNQLYKKVKKNLKKVDTLNSNNSISIKNSLVVDENENSIVQRTSSNCSASTLNKRKRIEGILCSKYHKLFTGLSEVNWKVENSEMFCTPLSLEKSNIVSVRSNASQWRLYDQMFFAIDYRDPKSQNIEQYTFQLVPRFVKNIQVYDKLNVGFPFEFEWSCPEKDISWGELVSSEKRNFCYNLACHFDVEYSETYDLTKSLYLNSSNESMESVATKFSAYSSTPKRSVKKFFRRLTTFVKPVKEKHKTPTPSNGNIQSRISNNFLTPSQKNLNDIKEDLKNVLNDSSNIQLSFTSNSDYLQQLNFETSNERLDDHFVNNNLEYFEQISEIDGVAEVKISADPGETVSFSTTPSHKKRNSTKRKSDLDFEKKMKNRKC